MRKLNLCFLVLAVVAFISCGNNDPVNHSSLGGSWRCEEFQSIGGTRTYLVQIDQKKSDTTQYLISNFFNVNIDDFVIVTLKKSNITFSKQQIGNSINVLNSGSGIVSADFKRMDLTYYINDGQSDIKVTDVYTRP